MKKTPYRIIACVALLMVVSACGGKAAKKQTTQTVKSTEDITRPPQISNASTRAKEQDPDETVSFDKWKKTQETPSGLE